MNDLRARLERFVALGKVASPWPWRVVLDFRNKPMVESAQNDEHGPLPVVVGGLRTSPEDCAFIAAAPQAAEDIAVLLAEGEAVVREIIEKACERFESLGASISENPPESWSPPTRNDLIRTYRGALFDAATELRALAPQAEDQSSHPAGERTA